VSALAGTQKLERDKTITVVGLGNIGSFLVGHLARLDIGRINVVDDDIYIMTNLAGQHIDTSDVGCSKAQVQMRRIAAVSPKMEVIGIERAVEDVPLGQLRGDILVACVDSRPARQTINQVGWRLGVRAVIDTGVFVDDRSRLGRISTYIPGARQPCVECAWSAHDYDLLEQRTACAAGRARAATATSAPSSVGAVVAGYAADIIERILSEPDFEVQPSELLIDLVGNRIWRTRLEHNSGCRFDHIVSHEHDSLELDLDRCTLTGMFAALAGRFINGTTEDSAMPKLTIRVDSVFFSRELNCDKCGTCARGIRLVRSAGRLACPCGGALIVNGFESLESVSSEWACGDNTNVNADGELLRRIGFEYGDILRLTSGAGNGTRSVELNMPPHTVPPDTIGTDPIPMDPLAMNKGVVQ
jgi:molybdopterin/thiamine biosynthesis adenylyltransferase